MKLLCVTPSYVPAHRFGGPIVSLHSMNKALAGKGVEVTVCTTSAGLEMNGGAAKESVIEGVKIIYFPVCRLFEFMGPTGWQFSPKMDRYLKSDIKDFDVVYILSIWNYPSASAAHYCRKFKKPYIISPRGMLYPYMFGKKIWKKFLYYHLVSKRDLDGAAAVHYTSADEFLKCHERLSIKSAHIVMPNGVDLEEFGSIPSKEEFKKRYPFLEKKKIILFLGRIHWKKGLDLLVPAFAELAKKRSDVHLVIAGNDESGFAHKVKKWIVRCGLAYNDLASGVECHSKNAVVTFTGMVTGAAKLEAIAGSDMFVLPSYSENFGMAAVEAMACAIPVIISDQVAICDEVKKAGAGIVVKNDERQITEAMGSILNDEEAAKHMGDSGRRLVSDNFSSDKRADKMIDALNGIISGYKDPR